MVGLPLNGTHPKLHSSNNIMPPVMQFPVRITHNRNYLFEDTQDEPHCYVPHGLRTPAAGGYRECCQTPSGVRPSSAHSPQAGLLFVFVDNWLKVAVRFGRHFGRAVIPQHIVRVETLRGSAIQASIIHTYRATTLQPQIKNFRCPIIRSAGL
jgi:hypothetical protein